MVQDVLNTPPRTTKPRDHGLTCLVDNGVPTRYFTDVVESNAHLIDVVKFGWCTALVTLDLEKKIHCLVENGVKYYFGGMLFEKALAQKKLDAFYRFLKRHDCQIVEISNGTLPISMKEKNKHIVDFAQEFYVLSQVGKRDIREADQMPISRWLAEIHADLESGAKRVVLEAGATRQGSACGADGRLRADLAESILSARIRSEDTIWEAPSLDIQASLISLLGSNVNLGNVAFGDVIALETLRQGICAGTFFLYEGGNGKPTDQGSARGRTGLNGERRRDHEGFARKELPQGKRLMSGMMAVK